METYILPQVNRHTIPVLHARGDCRALHYPTLTSLKIDGEWSVLFVEAGIYAELNNKTKYGRLRTNCPIIDWAQANLPTGAYLGELYWWPGKLGCLYDLLRHKTDDNLQLALWDIINFKGEDVRHFPLIHRICLLNSLPLPEFPHDAQHWPVSVIPHHWVNSAAEVEERGEQLRHEGWEGQMLKDPEMPYPEHEMTTERWAKYKPSIESIVTVYGFADSMKRHELKTLSLLVGFEGPLSWCGGGLSDAERAGFESVLRKHIIGETNEAYLVEPKARVRIEYQGLIHNPQGAITGIRHPVYIGLA